MDRIGAPETTASSIRKGNSKTCLWQRLKTNTALKKPNSACNALSGAFVSPPTPLKDIPKKNGESRSMGPREKRRTKKSRK